MTKKTLQKILKYILPVFMWSLVIFLFSAMPTKSASQIYWQDFIFKKSAHVVEYAILCLLLYRGFLAYKIKSNKAIFFAIFISVLYALSDEYHQSFTPGREPKIRDVGFDTLGSLISMYVVTTIIPKSKGRIKNLAQKLEII